VEQRLLHRCAISRERRARGVASSRRAAADDSVAPVRSTGAKRHRQWPPVYFGPCHAHCTAGALRARSRTQVPAPYRILTFVCRTEPKVAADYALSLINQLITGLSDRRIGLWAGLESGD